MKKISVFILISVSLNISGQNSQNMDMLIHIFQSLPDSLFPELNEEQRNTIVKSFKNKNYEFVSPSNEVAETFILNNRVFVSFDFKNDLFEISDNRSDITAYYQLKLFDNLDTSILGFSLKYSTHLTMEAGIIQFFNYYQNKILKITESVLNSFNYKTDNYADTTINEFNDIYNWEFRKHPQNEKLVYEFTESDTIQLVDNLIIFNIRKMSGIKDNHKYIMDNGKLRLAE